MSDLSPQDISEIRAQRHSMQIAFSTAEGQAALAWLLNECGNFAMEAAVIVPEKVALGNRLLAAIGIVHPANFDEIVRALRSAANENDLVLEERKLKEQQDEETL